MYNFIPLMHYLSRTSKEDRITNTFTQVDMSYMCLSGLNFDYVQLSKGILAHASCVRTSFRRADLPNSDFSFCDLEQANFFCANLRDACFYGADLKGADLSNADFTGADLRCVDFTGAIMCGTILSGAHTEDSCFCAANLIDVVW